MTAEEGGEGSSVKRRVFLESNRSLHGSSPGVSLPKVYGKKNERADPFPGRSNSSREEGGEGGMLGTSRGLASLSEHGLHSSCG